MRTTHKLILTHTCGGKSHTSIYLRNFLFTTEFLITLLEWWCVLSFFSRRWTIFSEVMVIMTTTCLLFFKIFDNSLITLLPKPNIWHWAHLGIFLPEATLKEGKFGKIFSRPWKENDLKGRKMCRKIETVKNRFDLWSNLENLKHTHQKHLHKFPLS